MCEKTQTRAGCDPAQDHSCNCSKICRQSNDTAPPLQVSAAFLQDTLVTAARDYLKNHGHLLEIKAQGPDCLPGLILEICKAVTSVAEKYERLNGGNDGLT